LTICKGFYRATANHMHGIAVEILSVRPSVRLSNACIVTKRKHLAKKVQLWLMGNRLRAFQWASDEHCMLPLTPKGGLKSDFFHFPYKMGFSRRKCYKVSLCENFQRQSCKAFTGQSIRAQMVGGGCPLVSEILDLRDPSPSKMALSSIYSLVAPQA